MILSGKRLASSPAEAEKKKPDSKTTPTEGPSPYSSSFRDVASRGYQPPSDVMEDWDGDNNEDDPWLSTSPSQSRRRRKWSTGRSPGGTPPQSKQGANRDSAGPNPNFLHRQSNADRSMGPNPDFLHRHTLPVFRVRNEGAFRDEIEVEIRSINGNPFRGSLTRHEAKHLIYKGVLGCPFSNFRGCKLGFKTCPTATFMLKEQINIDDLESVKDFSFKRCYMKQGQRVEDVLEGRVRGVRTVTGSEATASYSEEWTRVVKVEGCDYRVEAEMILKWLGKYGEVKSELVEDVFEDGEDSEGENATGIYSVKVKLNQSIPQLLPMDGRRVKIYYRGIQKLCTKCFGGHMSRNCSVEKIPWLSYVRNFVESNSDFDDGMFGNWVQILERDQRQKKIFEDHFDEKNQPPKEARNELPQQDGKVKDTQTQASESYATLAQQETETRGDNVEIDQEKEGEIPQKTNTKTPKPIDYNLPDNEEAVQDLIGRMVALGMTLKDATDNIDKRKKLLNQAIKKHQAQEKAKRARATKTRKESLND